MGPALNYNRTCMKKTYQHEKARVKKTINGLNIKENYLYKQEN